MITDLAAFNDDWLSAWSEKDVPRLLAFYAEDAFYIDPQVPCGVRGVAELCAYLTRLFSATPVMHYVAERIWPSADGYFGRWYCDIAGQERRLRGFDIVTLQGDKITFNEVYTHSLDVQ